ncbi:MAG: hypothetical protein IAE80_21085 [Anaerolinea sp.]|nr:hypothetical protein [Anaerolinea sp.]
MLTKSPRTETVTSRVTPEEHRRLMELAEADGRTLSNYLHRLICTTLQTQTAQSSPPQSAAQS